MGMQKVLILVTAVLAFVACSPEKPDAEKAKKVVEECLNAIDKGDIKTVREQYYTSEFVSAESEEELADKFKKLRDITGEMTGFEVMESVVETEMGEEACVRLSYKVKHARVTTREDFVVVIEGGKHKIGSHLVTNQ